MLESLGNIQESFSVSFADAVRLRESKGYIVVKMQTGDPDFPTHPNVIRAAHEAMIQGNTKYCDSRGLESLRSALVDKLKIQNSIHVTKENILITHGAVCAIGMVIRALINAGDECIILEPFWRAYESNVILSGGVPVVVKTSANTGFQLEAHRVLERITPRTKLIIINTPNNPSGAVYSPAELELLVKGAAERGVYVLSDEVYESLIFDGHTHFSIASNPTVSDWVISVYSFSKTFAMTGWRIGYLVAHPQLINELLKLSQFLVTSLAPYAQLAALSALKDSEVCAYTFFMKEEYQKRRNFISGTIAGTWLDDVVVMPQGAFYVLIDVSRFGMASLDMAKWLVEMKSVSFTPGIAFGDGMNGFLRMCFATSEANIARALEVLIELEKDFSLR